MEPKAGMSEFADNYRAMMHIVRSMKEIPDLPSEVPQDVHALEKVEFSEKDGVLTYMSGTYETGTQYPYRGFPFYEFVDKIDQLKKIGRSVLSGLFHELKGKPKITFLTLLPAVWMLKPAVHSGIYTAYRIVSRFRLKPHMYSKAVREVFRVLSLDIPGESDYEREFRLEVRDVLCMFLEFDNAYRYRFQDIMAEVDQKRGYKDIFRLFKLMQTREVGQEVSDTWTLLTLFFRFYLPFDGHLRRIVDNLIKNVNVDQVKLDEWDWQYCSARKDYKFGYKK